MSAARRSHPGRTPELHWHIAQRVAQGHERGHGRNMEVLAQDPP